MAINLERRLITKKEAAQLLNVSEKTVHVLTMAGTIPSVLIGKRGRRDSVTSLEKFIEKQLAASTK